MSIQDLEISIQEAQRVIAETPPDDFLLLDCRNRDEHAFVHIQDATLIPMDEIISRLQNCANTRTNRSLCIATWVYAAPW